MFKGKAILEWDNSRELWVVHERFFCAWKIYNLTIPKGFETDLASIPRGLRWLIPQVGKHIQPAIVHDYIYSGKTFLSRKQADDLFLDAMKAVGVSWWKRQLMHKGVRAGGMFRWQGVK